jgi:hypothetical protein
MRLPLDTLELEVVIWLDVALVEYPSTGDVSVKDPG